jgi:triacylglycerol lipase
VNRRSLRIWAIGLVPLVAVVVAVLYLRGGDGPVAQSRPGPVLLVAGYGGGTAGLNRLAQRLRADGRTAQVVDPVGDNTGDLREQAQVLDRAAKRAIAAGAPSVDVVGHSAGGVVARLWVAEGGRKLARRVVTLGSPHHGTQLAALGGPNCPQACRQLAPGSELLGDLPEKPAGPSFVSIWTANDQTVVPPDSAELRGAVNIEVQRICPGRTVTHGGLPADPVVGAIVEQELSGRRVAEPRSCPSGPHVP